MICDFDCTVPTMSFSEEAWSWSFMSSVDTSFNSQASVQFGFIVSNFSVNISSLFFNSIIPCKFGVVGGFGSKARTASQLRTGENLFSARLFLCPKIGPTLLVCLVIADSNVSVIVLGMRLAVFAVSVSLILTPLLS